MDEEDLLAAKVGSSCIPPPGKSSGFPPELPDVGGCVGAGAGAGAGEEEEEPPTPDREGGGGVDVAAEGVGVVRAELLTEEEAECC